jgi:hypothetical protein
VSESTEKLGARIKVLERTLLEAFNDLPPTDVDLNPTQVKMLDRIAAVLGLPNLERRDYATGLSLE